MSRVYRSDTRRQTGAMAEEIATRYLLACGYEILERNWRLKFGELDIVARIDSRLVFVEVRSKRASSKMPISEMLPIQKQQQVRKMAERYISYKNFHFYPEIRFDALLVEFRGTDDHRIHHVQNAF